MTAPALTATEPPAPNRSMWAFLLNPAVRIALRWAFIGILTLIAFWPSLVSLAGATRAGALAGYIWMVPVAAILAAQGVARRPRNELPIHDRQTDIIVGTMGLVFALLVHSVLLQRYALYFHLLRLDFLAMWVFVLSSAIVLFGLRPVGRFVSVWLLSLTVFVLPYHILVALLGGDKIAAGAATLMIAGAATGIAVGRTHRRGWIGGLAVWTVGLPILAVMGIFFPSAPLWVYTQLPSLTATALIGSAMFLYARRGTTKHPLNRKVAPLAAKQVLAGLPLVVVVAILLGLVELPIIPAPAAARFDGLQLSGPLNPPAGWHITETDNYPWVKRIHGPIANMTRQRMVADVGKPQWDKLSRPRTVMVDTVITDRPFSFDVFPAKVLYDVTATRLSKPHRMDLGWGVTGELVSVVDDHLLVTWNMLQWTWRNATHAQRVLLITVDNHDDNAPFPKPTVALLPTLNTLITVLFRGNSAVDDQNPTFKDFEMLTTFGQAIVAAQIQPLGRLQ